MNSNPNLSLTPRAEDTREVRSISVVDFELDEIKEHFDQNIDAINNQFDVAKTLGNSGQLDNQKNIYRSQIVFLESAFDFYLHELNKYGLRKIFLGEWKKTEKYKNLKVPMRQVEIGLQNTSASDWFTEFINDAYSRDVMTSYEYLKDQMNMLGISIVEILRRTFQGASKPERIIIDLYDRRNRIAHQTDRDHANAIQADISEEYVKARINEIVLIVSALHNEAKVKDRSCTST